MPFQRWLPSEAHDEAGSSTNKMRKTKATRPTNVMEKWRRGLCLGKALLSTNDVNGNAMHLVRKLP